MDTIDRDDRSIVIGTEDVTACVAAIRDVPNRARVLEADGTHHVQEEDETGGR